MGALALEREALIDVSASVASRNLEALERALRFAHRFADTKAVDEVLLQSHLFVGFPIALEALMLWRRIAPVERAEAPAADEDLWPTRGEAVCRAVYGRNFEKLRKNVQTLHPDFERWMLVGGYGRVIGREGLDLATRELCIVALLIVWDAPRQLHSHLRGALNAGASHSEVEGAVEVGCRYLAADDVQPVRALWARISPAASGATAE